MSLVDYPLFSWVVVIHSLHVSSFREAHHQEIILPVQSASGIVYNLCCSPPVLLRVLLYVGLIVPVYADYVNILGWSVHTLKENAEALVAATRDIGLEVSADKSKYMVMSRDQNAGRIQSVRIDNSTFERV